MIRCLLDAGADFNAQNEEGNTPLHYAARNENLAATQLLLKAGANTSLENNGHQTPKDLTVEGPVERLLRVRITEFPLHDSVRAGNKDDVEALLELKDKIDINKQDREGKTALHYAAEQADPAMVNILIRDDKINLSLEDNSSMTVLGRAALRGSAKKIKAILSSVVNPNVTNKAGRAPLHYAASRGDSDIIKALIDAGADVNIRTQKNQKTPLHCAAVKGDVESVRTLMENGANVDSQYNIGRKPSSYTNNTEIRNILRNKEENVDQIIDSIKSNDIDAVQSLLARGNINVNHKGKEERTPLHYAALFCDSSMITVLIKAGADPNAPEKSNQKTPLHHAAFRGNVDVVEALLKNGAKADQEDKQEKTPLDYAKLYPEMSGDRKL